MKKFQNPEIEVVKFDIMDVITTSTNPDCPNELERD